MSFNAFGVYETYVKLFNLMRKQNFLSSLGINNLILVFDKLQKVDTYVQKIKIYISILFLKNRHYLNNNIKHVY